ncbi:A-factor biosynthesis hotdog protein [Streptomyces sp. 1114.5]|uniref:ScbA/BarX family gamma-butyrolactone biosynthesis protein n=1 Tax=Streptomyces sp. 1114.5 TaxID=1938830 RepID=UPI000F13BE89|nr:ScbA/BarX family gamma-butyrolactone biosynthesis protein [Streptomyces sp. 1114.5]RKT17289.1 A-factor biosynthesis hotdog protein [Streptomyces sp. 1114.5]
MPSIVEPDPHGPYAHPGPGPGTGTGTGTGYDFHDRTVSRHLVHRASVSEVFLTGWQATGPYDFLLGAQWPRLHGFYRLPGDRYHDPVLMAETVRQAGLLIGHAGFGVPRGHHFVMEDLSYALAGPGLPGLAVGTEPASLMLAVGCEDVRMRHGRLVSLRVHADITRDGRPIGRGSGQLRVLSPASYDRLRGAGRHTVTPLLPPAPTAPELVGRAQPADVVLSPTLRPDTWVLRADAAHPVLFDHALDHVPGMLVLEAARQAAQRLRHPEPVVPVELVTAFDHYIELDRPCFVRAVPEPAADGRRLPVRVQLLQDGRTAAECRLLTEPLGGPVDGPAEGPAVPARRDALDGRPAAPGLAGSRLPLAS